MSKIRLQQNVSAFIAAASAMGVLNPLMAYGHSEPRSPISTVSIDKKKQLSLKKLNVSNNNGLEKIIESKQKVV